MSEPIGHPLQRYLDFKKVEEIMALNFFVCLEISYLASVVTCVRFSNFHFHVTCLHRFSRNNLLISWNQRTIRTFNHRTIRSGPRESKSKASNLSKVFIIRTSIQL